MGDKMIPNLLKGKLKLVSTVLFDPAQVVDLANQLNIREVKNSVQVREHEIMLALDTTGSERMELWKLIDLCQKLSELQKSVIVIFSDLSGKYQEIGRYSAGFSHEVVESLQGTMLSQAMAREIPAN